MADGAVVNAPRDSSWVGDTLDGIGTWSLRGKAPYILGLLMLFDSWDSLVIAFTLPVMIGEWGLSPLQSGSLISAGYGAQFFGALVFGTVAERFGRLPIIKLLVVIMCLMGIACAMATGYESMIVCRALQGLAIGGALPSTISYINEIAPTATRGRFFGTFQFLMTAGFGLASLMSAWLIPAYGWRIMFALGAVPLLFLPLTWMLPESPRWLAGKGRIDDAARALEKLGCGVLPGKSARTPIPGAGERVPVAMLFEPAVRNTSIIVGLLWFLTALVSFGLSNWIPSLYTSMFNIPVAEALRYNSVVAISIFILPIVLRMSIDKIGRRPLPMFGSAIGGLALLAMIFIDHSATVLLVGLAIVGQIGISICSMVLWPYSAETYATRVRSLALGTASSLARAASMITPLLVGGIIQQTGSTTLVFLIFGLTSLVVALLWRFGTKETAGKKMVD
jgi:MFS transporter, putative metabolite:H+ symporter